MTFVVAASRQQNIGVAVAVVAIVGWLIFIYTTTRRSSEPGSEVELAPNRKPYLDDEGLEGPRLNRALNWALVLMAVTAVGLPIYWLREPTREKGGGFNRGEAWFQANAIKHGEELFAVAPAASSPESRKAHFGCATCHGPKGEGGVAPYSLANPLDPNAPPRQVQWQAPALNTVTLRFRDSEIRNILVYGRAGTPMPAWGKAGGGPMNDQQIDDLITYLHSISIGPEKAKAEAARFGTDGRALFENFCARCHTLGFSYGEPQVMGGGAFGPNLTGGEGARQFPNLAQQVDWVTNTAEYGKVYGVRGISHGIMPYFGSELTAEQIQAIVAYERGL